MRSVVLVISCIAACAFCGSVEANLIAGTGPGAPSQFNRFTYDGFPAGSGSPYAGFTGGVRVAAGDLNGDGFDDIITGAGPGGNTHVKVFDAATLAEVRSFFAYAGFTGGVYVAAGDVNGDGRADVVTGVDSGPAGGHVKVFDGQTGAEIRSFFAYSGFTGGVRVAAGDVDGDGFADIVTGAGPGGGPHVKVFSGQTGAELRSFFAYDPGFQGGIFVASGDVNNDGIFDIVTGPDSGTGPHVKAFDGTNLSQLRSFFAYGPAFQGGVRVGATDIDADGFDDIITGPGAGIEPNFRVFSGQNGSQMRSFNAFSPSFTGGIYVAGGQIRIVPEPTTVVVMAAGLLAVLRKRRA